MKLRPFRLCLYRQTTSERTSEPTLKLFSTKCRPVEYTHCMYRQSVFSAHPRTLYFCSLILFRTIRIYIYDVLFGEAEAKLNIHKTSLHYIDVATLLLRTTEHIIIPISKFSTFLSLYSTIFQTYKNAAVVNAFFSKLGDISKDKSTLPL